MESIIHIGAKVDKESSDNLSSAILAIFASAAEHRMDQPTVLAALETLRRVFEVKNVTISDSSFVGEDKRVIVGADTPKSECPGD